MNLSRIAFLGLLLITSVSLPSFATTDDDTKNNLPSPPVQSRLEILYADRQYLWLEENTLKTQGHDALDFISQASQHGLNPDDYHWNQLQHIASNINSESVQQFDRLLSESLLTLIDHLKNGKLHPTRADPYWFIEKPEFDSVSFLQHALLQPHLKTELNTLIPDSEEYRLLKEALSRYQSYVDRGGWHSIPETPLLRPGDIDPNIALIQQRLAIEDDYLALTHSLPSQMYDSLMEQAVKRFQKRYSLKVDSIIGSETRGEMNISAKARLNQIKVAMERQRWMPEQLGERYIVVNLASFSLKAVKQGDEELDMPVIVGQKTRQTPSFSSNIDRLVFNPYWNVPSKLARLDLLPKQKKDPDYFYHHDIRVFSSEGGQRVEHDPYSIDWNTISSRHFPYTLRQDPGDHNSLGRLKFMFPNKWDIYLHDTPHKELFNEAKRSFSSGCIRVKDPVALANFTLDHAEDDSSVLDILASNQNIGKKLSKPMRIYVVYITASVIDGELYFSPDVYHRDEQIARML